MSDQQELDAVQDGDAGTSTGEAQSSAKPTTSRQPNWNEDPGFREYQSKQDQRISMAERRAQEAERRAAYIEQQVHETRMQGMDEAQKLAYSNQLLQQQLAEMQRQRDLDAYAIQRQRDLDEIARKTGVPVKEIEDAANVHDAWAKAYDWREANGKGRLADATAPRTNDTVDLGGGKVTSKSAALQAKYEAAVDSYDLRKQLEIMAEADSAGISLDENYKPKGRFS